MRCRPLLRLIFALGLSTVQAVSSAQDGTAPYWRDAWRGWHDTARGSRKDYQRFAELVNEGSRELGGDLVCARLVYLRGVPAVSASCTGAAATRSVEPGSAAPPPGKPPSRLRSQIWVPSTSMTNTPPVPGTRVTEPISVPKVFSSSEAIHDARSSQLHCVQ